MISLGFHDAQQTWSPPIDSEEPLVLQKRTELNVLLLRMRNQFSSNLVLPNLIVKVFHRPLVLEISLFIALSIHFYFNGEARKVGGVDLVLLLKLSIRSIPIAALTAHTIFNSLGNTWRHRVCQFYFQSDTFQLKWFDWCSNYNRLWFSATRRNWKCTTHSRSIAWDCRSTPKRGVGAGC